MPTEHATRVGNLASSRFTMVCKASLKTDGSFPPPSTRGKRQWMKSRGSRAGDSAKARSTTALIQHRTKRGVHVHSKRVLTRAIWGVSKLAMNHVLFVRTSKATDNGMATPRIGPLHSVTSGLGSGSKILYGKCQGRRSASFKIAPLHHPPIMWPIS